MYFLVKDHCFVDGNKRVGIQSAIVFLTINGYEDDLDDYEGYEKTVEICTINCSEQKREQFIDSLAYWVSQRFKKAPD